MYLPDLHGIGDTLTRQDEHAFDTVRQVLTPGPADREHVAAGIRDCYIYSGWRWHDNIVWVDSLDVLTVVSVMLGGRRNGLNELEEVSLSGRLRSDADAAIEEAESKFATPPSSRAAALTALDESNAGWAGWRPAAGNSSRTLAVRNHYRLQHVLGILKPKDTLAYGDALVSAAVARSLDDGPIGTRVSREAQAPLRFAELASLHHQANPALRDLRRHLDHATGTAASTLENAVNMADHVGQSTVDYLITKLGVGQPIAARHHALAASESAGWTWMHRDCAIVADRHATIAIEPAPPGLLTDVLVASDDKPAISWPNGHAVHRTLAEAIETVS